MHTVCTHHFRVRTDLEEWFNFRPPWRITDYDLCRALGQERKAKATSRAASFRTPRPKAWRKRRTEKFRNTRIVTFVFRIYILGYGTFQEIFLENVATFFIFCKTSFGPRTFYSGAPLGPRGPRPPARIGSKASWQIALRPHGCEYTRMMVS
jgi:hypothetical protein